MKILILGGTGILSTDVGKCAARRGYEVTCINRGNRGFVNNGEVKTIKGDVYDLDHVDGDWESYYDVIVDFLSFNVEQLKKKMQFFMNKGRQYILISSATVYQQTDEEITEESALGNSFWSYGVNKIACERYLSENHEKFGFEYTIIRPYVTYGNTRIPYALVNGEYWSLANRILGGKPILLWDGGQAICTLTHTEDFAVGLVGLFGNQMAYGQAFHITSDERLTWKKALVLTGKALQKKPEIFSASSKDISDVLPEYKGVLFGDKANNKIFNNSKIKNAVPDFSQTIPFEVGIKQTIEYFLSNRKERRVSYYWDGKMDRVILMLAKKEGRQIDKSILKFYSYDQDNSLENKLRYYLGRCKLFCIVYDRMKTMKR